MRKRARSYGLDTFQEGHRGRLEGGVECELGKCIRRSPAH